MCVPSSGAWSRRRSRPLGGDDGSSAPPREHGTPGPAPGEDQLTTTADRPELDDLDNELLNAVQWDFPLDARPYAVLGERPALTEPQVRERIAKVKENGVLRQLSAIFDTRALGYTSALIAAKIHPDHIDEAAAVVSAHPGV